MYTCRRIGTWLTGRWPVVLPRDLATKTAYSVSNAKMTEEAVDKWFASQPHRRGGDHSGITYDITFCSTSLFSPPTICRTVWTLTYLNREEPSGRPPKQDSRQKLRGVSGLLIKTS